MSSINHSPLNPSTLQTPIDTLASLPATAIPPLPTALPTTAAPLAPTQVTPLESMKGSITTFVESASRLALYKTLQSMLKIKTPQVAFHTLVNNTVNGKQCPISDAEFSKRLNSWLRNELKVSCTNQFLAEVLILIIPALKSLFNYILGNIFAQVEKRAHDEIKGLVTSPEKKAYLLNFISEKINRMIAIDSLISLGERSDIIPENIQVGFYDLLRNTSEPTCPHVIGYNQDGDVNCIIAGEVKSKNDLKLEFDAIYSELSKTLIDCFYPKFDFGLNNLEKSLRSTIESLFKSLHSYRDSNNSSVDNFKAAAITAVIHILTFILEKIVSPTKIWIDSKVLNLSHVIGDNLLKVIIQGSLECVYDKIIRNNGFQCQIQSIINAQLLKMLTDTTAATGQEITASAPAIHDLEKAALLKIHTSVMNFFRSASVSETFLGSLTESSVNVILMQLDDSIFPKIQKAYAQHFNENTLLSLAATVFRGATNGIVTIDLPYADTPNVHQNKTKLAHKQFMTTFEDRLKSFISRTLVTTPVAPQQPVPEETVSKQTSKGVFHWFYSAATSTFGAIGSLVYQDPQRRTWKDWATPIGISTANTVTSMVGYESIQHAVAHNFIVPKVERINKAFLNPEVLTALVQGSLPAVQSYLSPRV